MIDLRSAKIVHGCVALSATLLLTAGACLAAFADSAEHAQIVSTQDAAC